ncbi:uncharacterized protein LOC122848847 [Aphidius gifuensis]|uniref:uncharacterized protein LOC122848847 n=1 Tax=Aphidius gifuensis TaxID=684658 RepID=UPI001CDD41BC|nr:uncharacterized protein LOC122848847 [Aphidius gifuensis]XP_044003161.1 uncharacterized protein LOC122848847 [Aphidius gifuensis]
MNEVRIIDSTDPEDTLGSLTPSYEKNLSFKYSEINLEKKEELRPETQLISQWISECKKMEQTSKLNFCQKAKIYAKMKAQFESSKIVPGSTSKDCDTTSSELSLETVGKMNEARIIDSTDPEDTLGSSFKYSEINLEKKEELRPETQLISQWISKCKEMGQTSKLNFCQKAKIYAKMKAQFESSKAI